MTLKPDILIIGAGAVGAALAHVLTAAGRSCVLADRQRPGRESSWAAAGVLFPAHGHAEPSFRSLLRRGYDLHQEWAPRLLEETGIDIGLRRSGVLSVWFDGDDHPRQEAWETVEASPFEDAVELDARQVLEREPSLSPDVAGGFHCPEACQIHNPSYVEALVTSAARRGATVLVDAPLTEVRRAGDRLVEAQVGTHRVSPGQLVLAAGAWSGQLGRLFARPIDVEPMRGQVALTETFPPLLRHIVVAGEAYLVPRPNGRTIVGSTVERVGFDKSNTFEGISFLLREAQRLVPELATRPLLRTWSGLRPGSSDHLPTMDRLPGWENVVISTGHFRSGVILSTISALLVEALLDGREPELDLSPYRYRVAES